MHLSAGLIRTGMGKTIMMLSLILSQISQQPESARRPTLIVCPMSVLGQWCEEITTRSAPRTLRVLQYYGPDRIKDPDAIRSYDVVVTTYGVLSSEAGVGPCADFSLSDIFAAGLPRDYLFSSTGLLAVHWNRIVLDVRILVSVCVLPLPSPFLQSRVVVFFSVNNRRHITSKINTQKPRVLVSCSRHHIDGVSRALRYKIHWTICMLLFDFCGMNRGAILNGGGKLSRYPTFTVRKCVCA